MARGVTRAAVAQFAPGSDTAANLATIDRLAAQAAAEGASLVVFPEYASWFSPALGAAAVAAAQPLDGAVGQELCGIARARGIHLVAGVVESADAGRVFNTLVAIDPAGRRVATYRKVHLYDAFGVRESDSVAPGPLGPPQTFAWGEHVVGLQTCYDLRFPESTRLLVDAGATVILVPAEWVAGPLKTQHWRTLVAARAIENTAFVVAADQAPPIAVGASLIVDPAGVELAALGDDAEGVAVADLPRDRVDEVRTTNPALALRRYRVIAAD